MSLVAAREVSQVSPVLSHPGGAAASVVIGPGLKIAAIECAKGRGIILPGGKIERGETPAEGATRELKEEVGLRVAKMKSLCKIMDGDIPVFTYLVRPTHFRLGPANKEGVPLWATYAELRASVYGDYYEVIFKKLAENLLR